MPGPSDAQKSVEEFQRLLASHARIANAEVIKAYAPVYRRLQKDTAALVKVAKAKGLKPWQVMRMDRMKDLERQFLASSARFANDAGSAITSSQRAAVGLARTGAVQTVAAGLPPGIQMDNLARLGLGWNDLPEDAFTNFVGIAADGKPIGNLLAPLGKEAADGVKDAIGSGIALGKGPRETAQLVRVAAGMPLSRALLITRTETNRAFREATRLQYANNSQVVKGYRRIAAQSERTCIACIALDGTLYALDEPLNEHPNGRCALVPDVLDYADLGLDVERLPQPPTARDWLAKQPEATQRKMLGDARFEAIQTGQLHMNQLATVRQNAVWGDAAVVRPLRDLGLREGVAVKPPPRPPTRPSTPTPATPPPRPTGNLIDPQTSLPVRGSRTAPPDIDDMTALGKAYDSDIPLQWEAVGNKAGFLDTNPASMIAPTDKALVTRMVKEQEAWARAVGGAAEVNYEGMSIMAARSVNRALEQTIVRHNIRPLERIVTTEKPGSPFGRAYAYQTQEGGVHINMAMAENGSARSIGARSAADNARKANQYDAIKNDSAMKEYRKVLDAKKEELKKMVAERQAFIRQRTKEGRGVAPDTLDFKAALQSDERNMRRTIKSWETAVKKHDDDLKRTQSRQWSTAGTVDEDELMNIITHEIGHYYHRRYGWRDPKSLEVLSRKAKGGTRKVPEGYERYYDPETKNWTGWHSAGDEAYKISEYAGTNDVEFFAEAFADYYQGGTRISKKVKGFIEEVIETNKTFNYVDLESVQRVPLGELKGNIKSVLRQWMSG